ncbi:putative Resistance-Nodulation-Cell division transporter [Halomicronema hongdechloris C2206]|uniref:Protein translocase subunit SecD n=1 Tax=Halomicronema hongdechloris C2206 TaxID=1641165 RepID=A0A1Z3HQ33_9CYAN|nr:protein translocase subunit SecD [Halomicronema hongdechloris]ASC72395.1 putative Resistance-Nodulation-Cell division transporter [Halomicronema hongdechloris C2206]
MARQRLLLGLVVALAIAAVMAIIQVPTRLGLDLRGGSQLTLQVQPTQEIPDITDRNMEAVRQVVEGRVNGLGVSESVVQILGNDQLLVQLPGISDPEQAERVLGGTAQLEFRPQKPGTEQQLTVENQVLQSELSELEALRAAQDNQDDGAASTPETIEQLSPAERQARLEALQQSVQDSEAAIANLFESTQLTGDKLEDAIARPNNAGTGWEVVIEFTSEGADLFADMTRRIAGTGRSVGIFLDNRLISAPSVDVEFAETGITGGGAVISGNFDAQAARELEIQLRGGALPLPVEVVENRTVGPSLGRDSIRSSLYAAVGGLILVLIFMVAYYRLPGLLADLALVVYALLTWAAFNLLGVTITLPGIAGFILSIGMAVDANVLIFERTREELRAGKTLYRSVESGFHRAFSSILDSNVTTLIACAALFWFGAGLVKGFALTLAIGVAISMFTAVTCSRSLLLFVLSWAQFRKPELFCPGLYQARS